MNCELCDHDQEASFLCLCSRLYLCPFHFGQHFMNQGNHKFERLLVSLEPFAKSMLTKELNQRISFLKTLKTQLIIQTENIINQVKQFLDSNLKNLSKLLKHYKHLTKKTSFPASEIDQITDLIKSEMILTQPDSNKLLDYIKKFYSQPFFNIELDPFKEREFAYKHFVQTNNGEFLCLAISKDGNTLLTGSGDTTVRVWDVVNMKQIVCFAEHTSNVRCLALSNDSSLALSGSNDKTVILWDLKENCPKAVLSEHTNNVLTVCFSVDEKLIISGSKEIILWNIEFKNIFKKISCEMNIYCSLTMRGNLYIYCKNNCIEILDLITFQTVESIKAHENSIRSIATTKDNQFIITGSQDCFVKIWDTESMSLYAHHSHHKNTVSSISVTSNNQEVISGCFDGSLILWNFESNQTLHNFTFHNNSIYGVKSVNNTIFSVSSDSRIGITELSSKKFKCFLSLKPFITRFVFIKGNLVACGSLNDVIICDINKEEIVLKGHSDIVNQVCLSSKNEFLISTANGIEKNLIMWNIKSKSIRAVLNGHNQSVLCVDISSDDLNALSGDVCGKVLFWNLVNFSQLFLFNKHVGEVSSVKFLKNKLFAVSGGEDKQVFIWDLNRKLMHANLSGHNGYIYKVLITKDDKYIVSADYLDGIRIWNIAKLKQEGNLSSISESKQWLDDNKELKGELIRFLH